MPITDPAAAAALEELRREARLWENHQSTIDGLRVHARHSRVQSIRRAMAAGVPLVTAAEVFGLHHSTVQEAIAQEPAQDDTGSAS
jgi:hypothetical protein